MDSDDSELEDLMPFDDEGEFEREWLNTPQEEPVDQLELIAKSIELTADEVPRPEHLEALQRCFGHRSFRPMQWKIISSIINDRRDNCAIMATGYGKSLCFQYPPVYCGGIAIVISPLISLMQDQVLSLQVSNIPATLLGSAQSDKGVYNEIINGKYSLVYLTPEFCCGDFGQSFLKQLYSTNQIVLVAIDEAHCVSTWGHDFRVQYRQLGMLRSLLPNTPILAVTATATPRVCNDITTSLRLKNPQVLCSGFDRPNLFFAVFLKSGNVYGDLQKLMVQKNGFWTFPGSTIIYCISRKQTENVHKILKSNGMKCVVYHAGMTPNARKMCHESFAKDKVKVIIATIAFGMGIDKPDVRTIIHYGCSKDIESYYQEVGRAGRDGQPSKCITFYNNTDFILHRRIQDRSRMNKGKPARTEAMQKIMVKYLESRECRRQFILNHFEGGDKIIKNHPKCCDNCARKVHEGGGDDSEKYEGLDKKGLYDFAKEAKMFLEAVNALGGAFGILTYALFLKGSKSSKIYDRHRRSPLYGAGKDKTQDWWKTIGSMLERENFLLPINKSMKTFTFTVYKVGPKGDSFLKQIYRDPTGTKLLLQPPPMILNFLPKKALKVVAEEGHFIGTKQGKLLPLMPLPAQLSVAEKEKPHTSKLTVLKSAAIDLKGDDDTLYRLLLNKRTDLASFVDCMPYMVACNESLVRMAQLKPKSLEELRKCQLDGFTEAKISRFGNDFLQVVLNSCGVQSGTSQTKKSIQDALAAHPMPDINVTSQAECTYSMYKSGLTVQEIATKRGVLESTIVSHLAQVMNKGYPIKLLDLNITNEMRETITEVIRSHPDEKRLKVLKESLPDNITYDQIKLVRTFVYIRDHLHRHDIPYDDFEDHDFIPVATKTPLRLMPQPSNSKIGSSSNEPDLVPLSSTQKTSKKHDLKVEDERARKKIRSEQLSKLHFLDSPPSGSSHPNSHLKMMGAGESQLQDSMLEDDYFDHLIDDIDINKLIENSNRATMQTQVEQVPEKTHAKHEETPMPMFTFKQSSIYGKKSLSPNLAGRPKQNSSVTSQSSGEINSRDQSSSLATDDAKPKFSFKKRELANIPVWFR